MSILWTRRRQCVDDYGDEDHVDDDLGGDVSAMVLQWRVDDDVA